MWQNSLYELQAIMAMGDPPLGYRFLIFNSAILLIYMVRRFYGVKPLTLNVACVVQLGLVLMNAMIAWTAQPGAAIQLTGL